VLRPTKHTDPQRSLLFVSATALKRLQKRRAEPFDTLRGHVLEKHTGSDRLFVPALNLLFALGLIEYRPKTDSFEYVGPG